MQAFKSVSSVFAVLNISNIDTDMIIPKQFLKTITRSGLGNKLFFEMRYIENDFNKPKSDFILNQKPFDVAKILVTGDNFGCGSSREHAPWALADFGIRCVIAESFADIFYNNCFENGILPVILNKNSIEKIMSIAQSGEVFSVDLESQTIKSNSLEINFEIDEFKKYKLLNGLDSIGMTIAKMDKIKEFEINQQKQNPWL
jgi:3-isopropylmalate dehydratase small subunit